MKCVANSKVILKAQNPGKRVKTEKFRLQVIEGLLEGYVKQSRSFCRPWTGARLTDRHFVSLNPKVIGGEDVHAQTVKFVLITQRKDIKPHIFVYSVMFHFVLTHALKGIWIPLYLDLKTGYDNEEFELLPKPWRSTTEENTIIDKLYTKPVPLKKTKSDHLQQLKQVIPKDYHTYYENLQHYWTTENYEITNSGMIHIHSLLHCLKLNLV